MASAVVFGANVSIKSGIWQIHVNGYNCIGTAGAGRGFFFPLLLLTFYMPDQWLEIRNSQWIFPDNINEFMDINEEARAAEQFTAFDTPKC